jgi:hypothetical protein
MILEVEARLSFTDATFGEGSSDMARTQYDHLWPLAHAERAALANDLAGLGAEQWRRETLCGEWDVEQVMAHLTAAASLDLRLWLCSMLGARFRPDVNNQRRLAEHCGSTPAETLDRFRAVITSTTAPSWHPPATSVKSLCMPKTSASRWGWYKRRVSTRSRPWPISSPDATSPLPAVPM